MLRKRGISTSCFFLSFVISRHKYNYIYYLSLDQSWNWLDGLDVTFVKWENKSNNDDGKCSILIASNETWKKVECSRGYARVVCKVPLSKYAACP